MAEKSARHLVLNNRSNSDARTKCRLKVCLNHNNIHLHNNIHP